MQRLTEKQSAGYDLIEMYGMWCFTYCRTQAVQTCKDCAIYKAIQKLAEYEDLEEQGLLLRLPCKVGDTVYILFINRIIEKRVISIIVQRSFIVVYCENNSYPFSCEDFGKTVFLTKEEAEAKLKEMEVEE